MTRMRQHVDQVARLQVLAVHAGIDDQRGIQRGKFALQLPDDLDAGSAASRTPNTICMCG